VALRRLDPSAPGSVLDVLDRHGLDLWLQVDGGVSLETIERCAAAGAGIAALRAELASLAD